MNIPHLRDKKYQEAVDQDAKAIARVLNLTRMGHIDTADFYKGQYAAFAAMHGVYASDGNSKWTIFGNNLIALINWDEKGRVITGVVSLTDDRGTKKWIGNSTWKRHRG